MMEHGIGASVRRPEDLRFLTGAGRYLDDVSPPATTHAVVLRSPHAHARIKSIDVEAARGLSGVFGIYTGADWRADGLGDIPTRTAAKNSNGEPVPVPPRPGLAVERVRFVGEPVALVVAETLAAAYDAAEAVDVDYEPLDAVTDPRAALREGAPLVWDDVPGNLCVDFEAGDAQAVDAAFARAAHTVSLELWNNRVTAVPMEPRGALGEYDEASGHYTLTSCAQHVHTNRNQLAKDVFHVPAESIRHVVYDVGGGFGCKNGLYPEYALVLFAARRAGRPVKWICDRSEAFASDTHGREQHSNVELALDADGVFLGLRVDSVGNSGAFVSSVGPFTPAGGTARTQGGPYKIDAIHFRSRVAFTNTCPGDPYRGAGRPEAAYQIDRIVDVAAAELGFDPVELRRRNLIQPGDLPYQTPTGLELDCGDFEALLDRTLELSDWKGFAARAASARARGRRRGIGIAYYLGLTGGRPDEYARLSCESDGAIHLDVGCESPGNGHETVLAQIVSERLGVDYNSIHHHQGDTDRTPKGGGHGGSRGMETGGSTTSVAAYALLDKAKTIASHLLEVAEVDVEFEDGKFSVVGTDRTIAITDVFQAAHNPARLPPGVEAGLRAEVTFDRGQFSYPNGCHVAEVEVDPDTGHAKLVDYTVVHDIGTVINPMLADGQVHGGTAQGIGQALLEDIVYDDESGQLLSGSLMDYCLPRAADLSDFRTEFYEGAPTAHNPLGVKGAGEAGCGGSPQAIVSAVVNALREYGVEHIDMPLTPMRVWKAINGSQADSAV